MIQLLYGAIFGEMGVILLMLFKSPFRKLVILGLDRLKRGRGPVVVKTIGGTVLLVFTTSAYMIFNVRDRAAETAVATNPTDMVLMAFRYLEISLMGYMLFLALMIDRLHHYIRELGLLRKTMEGAKKQSLIQEERTKALQVDLMSLKLRVKKRESLCETVSAEAKTATGKANALKKQSEDLLMEYDRLLEYNQSLRSQLASHD